MSTAVVARLDSLGDVLISGPAVRAVAAAHDRVVFLTGPRGAAAAELLPGVDRVVRWRAGWVEFDAGPVTAAAVTELIGLLAAERPDALLILTSFHQSPLPLALIGRMAGVRWIGAICTDYPGSLLDLRHPDPGDIPEPLRALSLAGAAGWRLPPGDDGRLRVKRLPPLSGQLRAALAGGGYLAFHPGAAVPARQPSAGKSAELVRALARAGHHVVVTGTAAERELTATVAGDLATDLGGRTTLAELGALFAGARAVVAPNTGPAHLAAAVGAPIVSLFAPVVPAERWSPYGVPVVLCGDQSAPCRGSRARNCPVADHPCLDGIAAGEVVAAVAEIGSPRNGRGAPVIARHMADLERAIVRVRPAAAQLSDWGARLAEVLAGGGRLLACGNGGSAAEAQHLTAELVGRFHHEREPLSAIALHADTSASTAIVNDYGVEEMFARGVRAHGRRGDVLISLSTSGTSRNVLAAVKAAQEIGVTTWSLTGPAPNPLLTMSDDGIGVEADSTATVQEIHLLLVHSLCMAVDAVLLDNERVL